MRKKNIAISSKQITAVYASCVFVYISCTRLLSRLECNSLFVGLGGRSLLFSERKIWQ